jgi:hypothetical protein
VSERKNGLATLDDFRAKGKRNHNFSGMTRQFDQPEHVKLPVLGKQVELRRPTMLWFALNEHLPVSLGEHVMPAKQEARTTVEEMQERARWMKKIIEAVMVKPTCTDELLDVMDIDDALFIVRWAHGEVIAGEDGEAKSLGTFRQERGLQESDAHSENVAGTPV